MATETVNGREYVDLSGVKVFIDPSYSQVMIDALRKGSYEGGERSVMHRQIWPGDRVLEVGSAVGCLGMVAAKIVGADCVTCYEANPRLVEDSRRNFADNALNIRVTNAVLQNRVCWGGSGTTVPFYIHKDFWASSLAKIPGTAETISVQTRCFEQDAREFGANFLICDIEGGEIDLLTTADLSGFDRILMEVHYWAGREAVNKLIRKLIFDGFTVNFDLSFGSIVSLHRGLAPPQ